MNENRFSVKHLLLNLGVVLIGLSLVLLLSVRHAHWGPEGPVGGWLLMLPYLFAAGLVTVLLIALGTFSWVPGGRWSCFALWIGLMIVFSVSGYYSMSEVETNYEQFVALSGWFLILGCVVAINSVPSTASKTVIAATLGLGGIAGWLQLVIWLNAYASDQAQLAERQAAHEQEFQDQQAAAFRALGKDAPLWNYLGYMYISNEELRKKCHEIIANRPDRDEQLIQYLGNEVMASEATRYIAEFHPAPGPVLVPAFAQRSDLVLSRIGEVEHSDQLSERSYSDIKDIIGAAIRIQKGGGDLKPQLEKWQTYLKHFKNTSELTTQIEQTMGTR